MATGSWDKGVAIKRSDRLESTDAIIANDRLNNRRRKLSMKTYEKLWRKNRKHGFQLRKGIIGANILARRNGYMSQGYLLSYGVVV